MSSTACSPLPSFASARTRSKSSASAAPMGVRQARNSRRLFRRSTGNDRSGRAVAENRSGGAEAPRPAAPGHALQPQGPDRRRGARFRSDLRRHPGGTQSAALPEEEIGRRALQQSGKGKGKEKGE